MKTKKNKCPMCRAEDTMRMCNSILGYSYVERKGGKRMSKRRPSKRMSKRMSKKMRKTGGGIIPQDLINGGRNIMYGLGSTYNAMAGYPAPVNPLPYKDQLMGK